MLTSNQFYTKNLEETSSGTTGEPTDQLEPEETEDDANQDLEDDGLDTSQADFDDEPIEDDDEDLDEDEVKRLFPGEDDYTKNDDEDEPYEGIHDEDDDEGLVDDNMSGMPVIPSPS